MDEERIISKYNFSGIRDWNTIPQEDLIACVKNMMRIGMDNIDDATLPEVIRRTEKATLCDLQLPFTARIRPITGEDIERWKGFTSNIKYTEPKEWHESMRKLFPHLLDFQRMLSKAHKAGWRIENEQRPLPPYGNVETVWYLHNVNRPEAVSAWLFKESEYLTEKEVWQHAMGKGMI